MKKWNDDEIDLCVELINEGLTYDEIGEKLGRTKQSVRIKLNKLKIFYKLKNNKIEKECLSCGINFISLVSENRKFCSKSCSATINNKLYIKKIKKTSSNVKKQKIINKCLNCQKTLNRINKIYCDQNCFHEHKKNNTHSLIES